MTTTAAPAQDGPAAPRPGIGSGRLLLAIGIGVAALVVATTLVLLQPHPEPDYPVGSPESALQVYLRANHAGDDRTAYEALRPRIRATWPYAEYLLDQMQYRQWNDEPRAFIDRAETTDDKAIIHVTIEWSGGGGPTSDAHIRMVKLDGTWYVDQALLGVEGTYR